jgi:flavorubredoxin
METRVDPIADGIYRLSTFMPEIGPTGFAFNQFLIDAEEPLLFHTGMRGIFPMVSAAIERVTPVDRLRWISFAHVEADECGAMNEFLEAAPDSQVAHSIMGCLLTLSDQALRPPRALAPGEVMELGSGKRVVEIPTPHVPHNWESHVLFEEGTRTLFCGDILTQLGDGPALTSESILDAAIEAEAVFGQTSVGPKVPATLRQLAELRPERLAIMHGSSFEGDGAAMLNGMADAYESRFGCASVAMSGQS